MTSRVYFIKPQLMDGPIKIGCSGVPQSRLETFMIWSPWPLEIIGSVPGSLKDEQWLHRCFADCHLHHEWFQSAPHLRKEVATILADGNLDGAKARLTEKGSIRRKRQPPTEAELVRLNEYLADPETHSVVPPPWPYPRAVA